MDIQSNPVVLSAEDAANHRFAASFYLPQGAGSAVNR